MGRVRPTLRGLRSLGRLFVLGAALATLAACLGPEAEMRELVINYNDSLSEAYLKADAGALRDLVSPEYYERINAYLQRLGKTRWFMRTEVVHIDFIAIEQAGQGRATVRTLEKWRQHYADPTTGAAVSDAVFFDYTGEYVLLRHGGRWVIDWVESQRADRRLVSPGSGVVRR